MNTLRGKNVHAFVMAFHSSEGRGPTGSEICAALGLDRALLPRIVQRLEKQGVIRREQVFSPQSNRQHTQAQPQL